MQNFKSIEDWDYDRPSQMAARGPNTARGAPLKVAPARALIKRENM